MFTLIANSGLQFMTIEKEINTEEPLLLEGGKTLKYTCLETIDFFDDCHIRFDLCASKDGVFIPVNYAKEQDLQEIAPNGTIVLDHTGVPKIKKDTVLALVENYVAGSPEISTINSLTSYRIKKGHETFTAFSLLLGTWLPMPMYEREVSGQSTGFPNGWCRVKIDPIGERQKNGNQKFRFTWAFDTRLAEDTEEGILRPAFLGGSEDNKQFSLCNRADLLLGDFLNLPDGQNSAPVGDYLVSLLGLNLSEDPQQGQHKFKFLEYYIYLINYIRLVGASPEVTLYNREDSTAIPVDMSVDIGNSRTCAMLFQRGDFRKAHILRLRDMTEPWRTYENAFDMRIVFRKADFGGDLTQSKNLFVWPSLVRVGEEAKHLVYRALDFNGESDRTTNYSSPKRYLWDDRKFRNRWELMVTEDDPTNLRVSQKVFMEQLTDHFDDDGTFLDEPKEFDIFNLDTGNEQCRYSRQSLMTFVMIEMLLQAFSYVNSHDLRNADKGWGEKDCRRYLRNIIITCPTAMPLKEQLALRKAAKNASSLLCKVIPNLPEMTIIPDIEKLKPTDDIDTLKERGWLYDEALACQLVYLNAELHERYKGKVEQFFELKGHVRKDMEDKGYEGKSLTIGTIDIGAGTTDVMVAAYGRKGDGRLTPVPLYYDSFYTAGDDITHNLIRDCLLEGPDNKVDNMGSIGSALAVRIMRMTPDELMTIPRVAETQMYTDTVNAIRFALSEEEATKLRRHLVFQLMHHFFAEDSSNQSEKDRRVRLDFCTQVSIPIAQFFLDLLNRRRPMRTYSYEDLFPKEKPAQFVLDHFEHHFGFKFEDLSWKFDPKYIGTIVGRTMEPLIKVLSVVLYAYNCDAIVLSGRPTSLEPLTELFLKYLPIAPNRLVHLNEYRVGRWFPQADEEGHFLEGQKGMVAVGAQVGHLASTTGFEGLVLDFSRIAQDMKSTAKYLGYFDEDLSEVKNSYFTPNANTVTLKGISVFPYFMGCKQYNANKYQARPLFAIYNNSRYPQLNIMLQRNYFDDRENITIEEVTDMEGNTIATSDVDLRLQTIAHDGNFWMDKGAFTLRIQEK